MSQPAASLSWTVNNKPVQVSGISGKYYLPQLLLYLSLCFLRTNQILPYRIFLIITVTYVTLHSWHFDNPGELIILSFQESMVHNNKVIQHAGLGLESSMLELRWCQLRGWESSIKTKTLLCNASGHKKKISLFELYVSVEILRWWKECLLIIMGSEIWGLLYFDPFPIPLSILGWLRVFVYISHLPMNKLPDYLLPWPVDSFVISSF